MQLTTSYSKILGSVVVCLFLLSGCTEDSTTTKPDTTPVNAGAPLWVLFSYAVDTPGKEFLERYDSTGLYGNVELSVELTDYTVIQGSDTVDRRDTRYFFYPTFASPHSRQLGYSADSLRINGYLVPDETTHTAPPPFKNWFGEGMNVIQTSANENVGAFHDSVAFGAPVSVSQPTLLTKMSRKGPYTITWQGHGKDFVVITLDGSHVAGQSLKDYKTTADNTGSFTIPAEAMAEQYYGWGRLTVSQYELHPVTLTNGHRWIITGRSTHSVLVFIEE